MQSYVRSTLKNAKLCKISGECIEFCNFYAKFSANLGQDRMVNL